MALGVSCLDFKRDGALTSFIFFLIWHCICCMVHIAMRKKEIPHEFRIRGWASKLHLLALYFTQSSGICIAGISPILIYLSLNK